MNAERSRLLSVRLGVLAALIFCSAFGRLSAAEAGSRHPRRLSERIDLARAIPTRQFALLHEQRIGHTLWAAYLYKARFGNHPKICVMTASVLAPSYFDSTERCGQLWPGGGTKVPIRAFIGRDSTVNVSAPAPWEGPEMFGIFLLSPQVRAIDVHLGGGTSLKRATRPVSRADLQRLGLPEMRYACLSIRLDRQIRSVVAFGLDGKELAIGVYPRG